MAEKYIINMPLKTTPDDTDLMVIEDAQDTKRMTWANVVKPVKDLVDTNLNLIDTVDNTVAAHLAEKATDELVYSHVRKGINPGDVLYTLNSVTEEKPNVSINLGPISPPTTMGGNQVYLVIGFVRQATNIRGRGLWTIHRYYGSSSINGVAVVTPIYAHDIDIDISTGEIVLSHNVETTRNLSGQVIRLL